jgi:hypothetical protein
VNLLDVRVDGVPSLQAVMEVRRSGDVGSLNTIPYPFVVGNCLGWLGTPQPPRISVSAAALSERVGSMGTRGVRVLQSTAASSGMRRPTHIPFTVYPTRCFFLPVEGLTHRKSMPLLIS